MRVRVTQKIFYGHLQTLLLLLSILEVITTRITNLSPFHSSAISLYNVVCRGEQSRFDSIMRHFGGCEKRGSHEIYCTASDRKMLLPLSTSYTHIHTHLRFIHKFVFHIEIVNQENCKASNNIVHHIKK